MFSGVDFTVRQGGALILRGPNGSGKTSFLRMVAGLPPPAAGTLRWRGREIREDPESWRRALRLAGHADAVKPLLTVAENLRFWARFHGVGAARVGAALEAFGLSELADAPARFLSAGQRRRLCLARPLAAPAPVWLLDEPASNLDAAGAGALRAAIAEHRAAGGLVIAATHVDLGLAAADTLTFGA